jgi:hypothetical protein
MGMGTPTKTTKGQWTKSQSKNKKQQKENRQSAISDSGGAATHAA